mgnify:CR=1 FL=1
MSDYSDRILELRWHAQDGLADHIDGVGTVDGIRGGDGEMPPPASYDETHTS